MNSTLDEVRRIEEEKLEAAMEAQKTQTLELEASLEKLKAVSVLHASRRQSRITVACLIFTYCNYFAECAGNERHHD